MSTKTELLDNINNCYDTYKNMHRALHLTTLGKQLIANYLRDNSKEVIKAFYQCYLGSTIDGSAELFKAVVSNTEVNPSDKQNEQYLLSMLNKAHVNTKQDEEQLVSSLLEEDRAMIYKLVDKEYKRTKGQPETPLGQFIIEKIWDAYTKYLYGLVLFIKVLIKYNIKIKRIEDRCEMTPAENKYTADTDWTCHAGTYELRGSKNTVTGQLRLMFQGQANPFSTSTYGFNFGSERLWVNNTYYTFSKLKSLADNLNGKDESGWN